MRKHKLTLLAALLVCCFCLVCFKISTLREQFAEESDLAATAIFERGNAGAIQSDGDSKAGSASSAVTSATNSRSKFHGTSSEPSSSVRDNASVVLREAGVVPDLVDASPGPTFLDASFAALFAGRVARVKKNRSSSSSLAAAVDANDPSWINPMIFTSNNLTWKLAPEISVTRVENACILKSGLVVESAEYERKVAGRANPPEYYKYKFDHWFWSDALKNIETHCFERERTYSDSYISLVQIYQEHYQHVVFDTLPKLSFLCGLFGKLRSAAEENSENSNRSNSPPKILVKSQVQKQLVREVCTASYDVGLREDDFAVWGSLGSGRLAVDAKVAYIPQFQPGKLQMGMAQVGILKPLGREALNWDGSGPIRILYLQRNREEKARRVTNEARIFEVLNSDIAKRAHIKWETFHSTKDWREDRLKVEQAHVILGPHGGAMGNMFFADQNACVIEFTPVCALKKKGENERPCYLGMALSLGLRYFAIKPESFTFTGPMVMDEELVLAAVLKCIEEKRKGSADFGKTVLSSYVVKSNAGQGAAAWTARSDICPGKGLVKEMHVAHDALPHQGEGPGAAGGGAASETNQGW